MVEVSQVGMVLLVLATGKDFKTWKCWWVRNSILAVLALANMAEGATTGSNRTDTAEGLAGFLGNSG